MVPLSVQMYSLRELAAKDFYAAFKTVADIGYKGIELSSLQDKTAAEARKMLDDLGLVVSSAHVPLPTRENIAQTVDQARTLGYTVIIVPWASADRMTTPESLAQLAADLQAGAELLKPHGMTLGYHNHPHELEKTGDSYRLEHLLAGAPDVFSELDVYWASHFGEVDVPAFIRKHASRMPMLHLKDGPLVKGEPMTAVGSGKMDIPACIAAADPKLLKWLVVELDACATDMAEAIRQSYRYLVGQKLASGNK